MPADHYITDADMKTVADAIRAKAGTADPLVFPDGMKNAIDGISNGGDIGFMRFKVKLANEPSPGIGSEISPLTVPTSWSRTPIRLMSSKFYHDDNARDNKDVPLVFSFDMNTETEDIYVDAYKVEKVYLDSVAYDYLLAVTVPSPNQPANYTGFSFFDTGMYGPITNNIGRLASYYNGRANQISRITRKGDKLYLEADGPIIACCKTNDPTPEDNVYYFRLYDLVEGSVKAYEILIERM